jgi:hypothetical protein
MSAYQVFRGWAATLVLWMQICDLFHHLVAAMPRIVVTAALLLP